MSIRDGKAKTDQVLGRVEEILGQSYADLEAVVLLAARANTTRQAWWRLLPAEPGRQQPLTPA